MNRTSLFVMVACWLIAGRTMAQPGLRGDYYTGTEFNKKVFSRIDRQLNFNWAAGSPGPGMPHSYYSIRWTGKLLAPVSGRYQFYAKVDDGIRVWVGNRKVMDSWQLNDSRDFTGSVVLRAGQYYDLRVDYFNDMMKGELHLYWQRPDEQQTVLNSNGSLVPADVFFQKELPVSRPPAPVIKPPVVTVSPPKPVPKKTARPTPKPTLTAPLPAPGISPDTVGKATAPARLPAKAPTGFEPDTVFNLRSRRVRFDQSDYGILPESAAELDQLVLVLNRHPAWNITVTGHTDNVGDVRLNQALSENRAKVVATYLARRGIANERMVIIGYGGTRPVSKNNTEDERSENRRVDITIR